MSLPLLVRAAKSPLSLLLLAALVACSDDAKDSSNAPADTAGSGSEADTTGADTTADTEVADTNGSADTGPADTTADTNPADTTADTTADTEGSADTTADTEPGDTSGSGDTGVTAECGNGLTEEGEGCDDGNTVTEECAYGEAACEVCNATCALVPGALHLCGDGIVDAGESCDDPEQLLSLGCSGLCDCLPEFHLEAGVCESDTRDCTLANATAATESWGGLAYSGCTATACAADYHLDGGACVNDTRDCTLANATAATETWDGSAYAGCTATACELGFVVREGLCQLPPELAFDSVCATIPISFGPGFMKVQPNTGLVYVTTSKFSGTTAPNVQIIDPVTNTLVDGFAAGQDYTWPIAFSSDGTIAYVVDAFGTLILIDTASQAVMASVPSLGFVPALAYQSATGLIVVPEDEGRVISFRDGTTAEVVRTIDGPGGVVDMVLSSDGETAYVSDYLESGAAVIDLSSGTISARIATGANPSGVALNPTETLLYVASYDDNTVSVIDLASNAVVATIGVGTNPNSVAFNLTGNLCYVTNNGEGSVSIIDVATSTNIGTLTVGSSPLGVLVLPSGDLAYVANQGGDSISILCRATR